MNKKGIYEKFLKRLMDFFVSFIGLVILTPFLIVIIIIIRLKLGSPVFYKQQRPGLNEQVYYLYKFRTMSNEKDDKGNLLPDNIRLTRFGKWLRSTSIDEIPSLLNIIRGDMSLVGPRPQLVIDAIFMSDIQKKRHSVKPGLTGLAQINGRNRITWEEKLNFDLLYISNVTFANDLAILIKTFFKVIKRENINQDGHVTSEDLGVYLLRTGKISYDDYSSRINSMNNR